MTDPFLANPSTEQQISWIAGSVHTVVLDGAATDGRLAVFRSTMIGGAASPVHVHDLEDETVIVQSGHGMYWAGDQRYELGPGDTVFLPRDVPHCYTFTSERAEILTFCNPAGIEDFFREVGWDLKDPKPDDWAVDMAAMGPAGEARGQHVLGPPLAPGDEMPREYLSR